jgi:hypothetical protein
MSTHIEFKERHEIDVIFNNDAVRKGTISRSEEGDLKWTPPNYCPPLTVSEIETILKAMATFSPLTPNQQHPPANQ